MKKAKLWEVTSETGMFIRVTETRIINAKNCKEAMNKFTTGKKPYRTQDIITIKHIATED